MEVNPVNIKELDSFFFLLIVKIRLLLKASNIVRTAIYNHLCKTLIVPEILSKIFTFCI